MTNLIGEDFEIQYIYIYSVVLPTPEATMAKPLKSSHEALPLFSISIMSLTMVWGITLLGLVSSDRAVP